ncbi:MAG: hypothetical protein QM768_12580 [Agriterribacter sp.]
MKYYIISEGEQLVLYKVANELIEEFENKHKDKVIASGVSIAEALLDFEQANSKQTEQLFVAKSVKYKNGMAGDKGQVL